VSLRRFRMVACLLLLLLPGARARLLAAAGDEAPDPPTLMLAKSHFEKGMKLLGADREKEGEGELREAVRIFPDFADAYIQLGNLAMRRKDFTGGLESYLRAETALGHLQQLSRRAEMQRRKRLQESIDVLQERIRQLQTSQRAGDAGKIQEAMARMDKLRQEQTKVFPQEGSPVPAELHFLVGNARMSLERYDEAIRDFNEALALRPGFGEVHNNLAVIYFYRKDYARAWEHFHAAEKAGVRVNPQFREELSAADPEPVPPP